MPPFANGRAGGGCLVRIRERRSEAGPWTDALGVLTFISHFQLQPMDPEKRGQVNCYLLCCY